MKTNEIGIELKELGLRNQSVYRNLTVGELVDDIVANNEGLIGLRGAAMVDTGIYTGRSPKDKYIVDEPSSNSDICLLYTSPSPRDSDQSRIPSSA